MIMRLTSSEVETIVLSSLSSIKIALSAHDSESAEIILDCSIQTLLDHGYFSAAWDLIDQYKRL